MSDLVKIQNKNIVEFLRIFIPSYLYTFSTNKRLKKNEGEKKN